MTDYGKYSKEKVEVVISGIAETKSALLRLDATDRGEPFIRRLREFCESIAV